MPPEGLPVIDRNSDPQLARFTSEIGAISHRVPRLQPDSEESSPVPVKEIWEYVAREEGFPEGSPPEFEFVRTGAILDTSWWLWRYRDCRKAKAFVSVHVRGDTSYVGTTGAPATLSTDQVLYWEFCRGLESSRSLLVRDKSGWRVAHQNEAAAARAATFGLRPDAIPPEGLPDFAERRKLMPRDVFMFRDSARCDEWLQKFYEPLRTISTQVPRLPDDSPAGCPLPLDKVRSTAWIYGLDDLIKDKAHMQRVLDEPDDPPGFRFERTGHVLDMLAWVWSYRSTNNPKAHVIAYQRQTEISSSDFSTKGFLSVDQMLLALFLHKLENNGQKLVRKLGVWSAVRG